MTGRVYQRDKSRRDVWQLIIELGRDETTGKRLWKYESVRGTKGHAKQVLRQRLNELEAGTYVEPSDVTVAELLRCWHEEHSRHCISPRTHESYGYIIRRHLDPGLGAHKTAKLRPARLQTYYSARLDSGAAASSVRKEANIIHASFKHAIRMGQLATNPADVAVPPRPKRTEMKVLDEKQSAAMLRTAAGTSLHMALQLALGTGMRRSELLGTRWSDVDLNGAMLTVTQTLQEAGGSVPSCTEHLGCKMIAIGGHGGE